MGNIAATSAARTNSYAHGGGGGIRHHGAHRGYAGDATALQRPTAWFSCPLNAQDNDCILTLADPVELRCNEHDVRDKSQRACLRFDEAADLAEETLRKRAYGLPQRHRQPLHALKQALLQDDTPCSGRRAGHMDNHRACVAVPAAPSRGFMQWARCGTLLAHLLIRRTLRTGQSGVRHNRQSRLCPPCADIQAAPRARMHQRMVLRPALSD